MQFQILEILLWPRVPTIPVQRLPFKEGALNVISGVSRTGKSAVIPIVDYCLGSDSCSIPVSTIRDRCSWFGIILSTQRGQLLLARREPAELRSTGDMFVLEGVKVEPPQVAPLKNTTAEQVKRLLDERAGLTMLDFDLGQTGSGFKRRPSFRDMMAFVFQPQNIVANQNTLFFKADTHEHREKLRTIFPYVLGAISPEILAKQHELIQLRRVLQLKDRELGTLRQISERWISEIRAWESRARELGFLKAEASGSDIPAIVSRLLDLVRNGSRIPEVTEATIDGSVRELVQLQKEETEKDTKVVELRSRLAEMERLKKTAEAYRDQLEVQRDRLGVSEWLGELRAADHTCPLCGQEAGKVQDGFHELIEALKRVENSAGQATDLTAAFDRELQRVRDQLRPATEQLEGIRHRIRVLAQSSEEAKRRHDAALNASRFLGQLEQALEHYSRIGEDGDLAAEVEELRLRVARLEKDVEEGAIEKRTDLALKRVTANTARLMPSLDTERPDDLVSLSIDDLTIRVAGKDREDLLSEIGSGSNWLSYHLAICVALQEFFLSMPTSPVPSLLVFDQPSQVYFPRRLADKPDSAPTFEPKLEDEDVVAVRKAFEVLAGAVRTAKQKLQIVVLDHATDTVWHDIQPIHVVADWRDGRKLVPEDWPSVSSS